jgi:hypothetical protein
MMLSVPNVIPTLVNEPSKKDREILSVTLLVRRHSIIKGFAGMDLPQMIVYTVVKLQVGVVQYTVLISVRERINTNNSGLMKRNIFFGVKRIIVKVLQDIMRS